MFPIKSSFYAHCSAWYIQHPLHYYYSEFSSLPHLAPPYSAQCQEEESQATEPADGNLDRNIYIGFLVSIVIYLLHGQNLSICVKSVWSYFPLTCFARLLRNSFAKGDPEQPLTDPINSSSKQFSQAARDLFNPILMTRERPKFFF